MDKFALLLIWLRSSKLDFKSSSFSSLIFRADFYLQDIGSGLDGLGPIIDSADRLL